MHLMLSTLLWPSAAYLQVFQLHPGMQSRAFWHEISLLARCMHPRVVPVYGVAIQARSWAGEQIWLRPCRWHLFNGCPPPSTLGSRLQAIWMPPFACLPPSNPCLSLRLPHVHVCRTSC